MSLEATACVAEVDGAKNGPLETKKSKREPPFPFQGDSVGPGTPDLIEMELGVEPEPIHVDSAPGSPVSVIRIVSPPSRHPSDAPHGAVAEEKGDKGRPMVRERLEPEART